MRKWLVWAVRALIVVMTLGALAIMGGLLPMFGLSAAEEFPEVSYLFWPTLVLTETFMVAALVVLGSMWVLVGMVGRDQVFTPRAWRYVDAIIVAFLVAAAISGFTLVWIVGFVDVGGPPIGMLGMVASVGSLAGATLMALMRGLLVKATEMRDELAEVV